MPQLLAKPSIPMSLRGCIIFTMVFPLESRGLGHNGTNNLHNSGTVKKIIVQYSSWDIVSRGHAGNPYRCQNSSLSPVCAALLRATMYLPSDKQDDRVNLTQCSEFSSLFCIEFNEGGGRLASNDTKITQQNQSGSKIRRQGQFHGTLPARR